MKIILNVFLFIATLHAYSQVFEVEGRVVNMDSFPLEGATVIINFKDDLTSKKYTITNERGAFKLLVNIKNFDIKVSYIGYNSKTFTVTEYTKPITITLSKSNDELGEVFLDYKPKPVIVKRDTVSYNVSDFIDGNERKMKDVLEKLPGVTVEGDKVYVQGKQVTKVLVEDEKFFQGNTKFATDNIPADVIKKIDVIDDFQSTGFLTGVTDSDKVALNVKLKEGKKAFSFGTLGGNYGNENFYNANATLINYRKEQQVAILGSGNNTASPLDNIPNLLSSPSFDDSYSKIDASINALRFQDKFYKVFSTGGLGVGFNRKINKHLDFDITSIFYKQNNEKEKEIKNQYLTPDVTITEKIDEFSINEQNKFLFNTSLRYRPNENEDLIFYSFLENEKQSKDFLLNSVTPDTELAIENFNDRDKISLKNSLSYNRKFSEKIISTFLINYSRNVTLDQDQYISSNPLFQDFTSATDFVQEAEDNLDKINFKGDFYYSFSKKAIVDIMLEKSIEKGLFDIDIAALNPNESILNDERKVNIDESTISSGFRYLKGDFELYSSLKIGAVETNVHTTTYLSPVFNLSYKKSFTKEASLKYEYVVKAPLVYNLKDFSFVDSYNTFQTGNFNLKPEEYHVLEVNGAYSNFSKGFSLYGNLEYKKYNRSYIQESVFNSQIVTSSINNTNANREEVSIIGTIGKVFDSYKLNFTPILNFSKFPQNIAGSVFEAESSNLRFRLKGQTIFTELPNIGVSFTKTFTQSNSISFNRKFNNNRVSARFFDKKGALRYSLNYSFVSSSNEFFENAHQINFNISYELKNTPWEFSLLGENLLNQNIYSTNYIDSILISEENIQRIPRYVLIGGVYRF